MGNGETLKDAILKETSNIRDSLDELEAQAECLETPQNIVLAELERTLVLLTVQRNNMQRACENCREYDERIDQYKATINIVRNM